MYKISIIIPVYNCSQYLDTCISSLINQTLQDIEIILVNDSSTDNSLELCNQYDDKRIKVLSQPHSGQSKARNNGLDIARGGEYIGFVDADDWVDEDYFERLYNTAQKYDADIAMADFIRKGPKKHKIRLNLTSETVYTTIEDKIKTANALKEGCIWNKIYRNNVVENLRFNEGMFFEDGPFTIRALFKANKLVTVPNTYYYYRQNPNSTVKTMDARKRADKQKSKREILDFIKANNIKIKDRQYWAIYKKYPIFSIEESVKSKRLRLFGLIPINLIAYKLNTLWPI